MTENYLHTGTIDAKFIILFEKFLPSFKSLKFKRGKKKKQASTKENRRVSNGWEDKAGGQLRMREKLLNEK